MRADKFLVTAVLALGLPVSAQAPNERTEIARCSAIASPAERLACFDALAKKLGVSGPKVATTLPARGTGKWKISTEASPIDDSKNVYVDLDAEQTIAARLGRVRPTLILRCKENKTEAYIAWETYLGLDETEVLVRLDNEQATTSTWNLSTNNSSTFYRGGGVAFIKQLLGHQRLLVQVTPYGESPVMATFALAGVERAIKSLQDSCGWK